jgi:hypothetical protein
MIMHWIDCRCKEISSKLGALLAACAGAASVANALSSPWNYVAFASALLLVLFPENKVFNKG